MRKSFWVAIMLVFLLCGCSEKKPDETVYVHPDPLESSYIEPDSYVSEEDYIEEDYIDEEYWEYVETPDSNLFSEIVYWHFQSELHVVYKSNGDGHIYYNVEPEVWDEFKHTDDTDAFFRENIKNNYENESE